MTTANDEIFDNQTDDDVDLFALAFDEADKPDVEPDTEPVEPEEPKAEEPEPVAEEPVAEVVEEPTKEEEPVAEEPKEEPKAEPKAKTEAEIRAELEAEMAAAKAQEESAKADKAKEDEAKAKENLTDEEKALKDEISKDFPDISKALEIQERVMLARFENMMEAKMKEVNAKLAPVMETSQAVARNSHEAAILGKHSDAFDLLPKVEAWIDSQPTILKNAYNNALDAGTSEEVIELFDVYKSSLEPTQDAGESAEEKAQREAAEAKEKEEREKKLASQEGIKTRQTTRTEGVDENDFEGGFNAAASKP